MKTFIKTTEWSVVETVIWIAGSDYECVWNFKEPPRVVYNSQAQIEASGGIDVTFSTEKVGTGEIVLRSRCLSLQCDFPCPTMNSVCTELTMVASTPFTNEKGGRGALVLRIRVSVGLRHFDKNLLRNEILI